MLSAKLTVVGGDARAAEISLKLPTTIGRGRDVTLTLPHPLVSRKHCEIFEREGTLFVRDLKSLNGTYVDSQRIDGTSELRPDQLLTIGTVTFRAHYSVATVNANENGASDPAEAGINHVVEMSEHEPNSADRESNDRVESLRDKKTTPGRRSANSAGKPTSAKDLVRTEKVIETESNTPVSNHVLENESIDKQAPEHSVCAAMLKSGAAKARKSTPASLEEIRGLLPGIDAKAKASSIEGLETNEDETPVDDVDFQEINVEETIRVRVNANDSALGSFIRKMPR